MRHLDLPGVTLAHAERDLGVVLAVAAQLLGDPLRVHHGLGVEGPGGDRGARMADALVEKTLRRKKICLITFVH